MTGSGIFPTRANWHPKNFAIGSSRSHDLTLPRHLCTPLIAEAPEPRRGRKAPRLPVSIYRTYPLPATHSQSRANPLPCSNIYFSLAVALVHYFLDTLLPSCYLHPMFTILLTKPLRRGYLCGSGALKGASRVFVCAAVPMQGNMGASATNTLAAPYSSLFLPKSRTSCLACSLWRTGHAGHLSLGGGKDGKGLRETWLERCEVCKAVTEHLGGVCMVCWERDRWEV